MIVSIVSFESLYAKKIKGGGAEIARRVKLMEENGLTVFVHSFANSPSENNISREALYRRSILSFLLTPWLPIPVSTRNSGQLAHNIKKNQPDIVIIEGFQSSRCIKEIKKMKVKTILRIHNIESDYHKQMYKSTKGIKKIYHLLVSMQYRWFEKRVIKHFDLILHISKEEYENSFNWMGKKSIYAPPIANPISRNSYNFSESGKKNILLFGDFSIGGNFIGADWFVSEVFPILSKKYPELILHIIGIDSYKLAGTHDRVNAYGYVDDINKFFEEKRPLVVIPIAFGGGVKIKTIDTMISGIPAIYSCKSLEGITEEIKEKAISFREFSNIDTLAAIEYFFNEENQADINSSSLKDVASRHFDGKLFMDIIMKGASR